MPESQLNSYTITSLFILISSQRKNTPPQEAVIIPTGISIGAKIVLDTVSAAVRNDAPRRKEQGRMIRLSTPSEEATSSPNANKFISFVTESRIIQPGVANNRVFQTVPSSTISRLPIIHLIV